MDREFRHAPRAPRRPIGPAPDMIRCRLVKVAQIGSAGKLQRASQTLCDRPALALEAAGLIWTASPIADAFCHSRLESRGAHHYGALTGVDCRAIVTRATVR
jgi:hypothetical protein